MSTREELYTSVVCEIASDLSSVVSSLVYKIIILSNFINHSTYVVEKYGGSSSASIIFYHSCRIFLEVYTDNYL